MEQNKFAAFQDFDFSVTRDEKEYPSSMQGCHYHNHYEIYYLCSGDKYYIIEDKCYPIKRGSMVLVNKYDVHYTTAITNQGFERLLITFNDEYIKDFKNNAVLVKCFENGSCVIDFPEEEQPFIEKFIKEMLKEFESENEGKELYLKCALAQLLLIINRHTGNQPEEKTEYMNSTYKTITEITGYINTNFWEDITLNSISEKFFISPYYFSRTFKKVTGFTFVDYLNNVRIKEAQLIMQKKNMNVTKLSQVVGYKSTTHFSRTFKKITGMSPLEYKKKTT